MSELAELEYVVKLVTATGYYYVSTITFLVYDVGEMMGLFTF